VTLFFSRPLTITACWTVGRHSLAVVGVSWRTSPLTISVDVGIGVAKLSFDHARIKHGAPRNR
jgi:hypothetical protein